MHGTAVRLLSYLGPTTRSCLRGGSRATLDMVSPAIQAKYPQVTTAKIQGSKPHMSHKDPRDKKPVITVSYHTKNGTRVCSVHVHSDGSWTEFPKRNAQKGRTENSECVRGSQSV